MKKNNNLKVLIAEDDYLVGEDITRIIKEIGYECIGIASNGLKAVEMAKTLNPDIILMDIKMPKMNGLDAAKEIQLTNPTPIVILTAHETMELVNEATEAGVGAYITKPPNSEEVERAITIAFARQTDLIKSRELVEKLKQKEKELKEINKSKDKFFSIIAHDLRNPLASLIGYSDLLVVDYQNMDDEERQDINKTVNQISINLSGLLESLLIWARYETGKMEYRPVSFEIWEAMCSVLNLLESVAEKKNIKLSVNMDETLRVFADYNMVETIIRNLVSNAIKFTPVGGSVKIEAYKMYDMITIVVEDTGVGMDQIQIKEIFKLDKSVTTKGTDDETGTGLGLVLCKELITANKGTINIESQKNVGTKISFTLPVS